MLGNRSSTVAVKASQPEIVGQPTLPKPGQFASVRSEHDELRSAMRVLGAVVGELAERIEILETRESVREAAESVARNR